MLKLERPIVVFDLETTGVDTNTARIVEIAVIKILPDRTREEKSYRINPTIPIPAEASEVHGITDDDVKECPTFAEYSKGMFDYFTGCDIAGYNSDNYDVPLLSQEFARCNMIFPEEGTAFVDVLKMERHVNAHNLGATYKRYSGEELDGAHGALADTRATAFILEKQLERNFEEEQSPQQLDILLQGDTPRVDIAGKLTRDTDGTVVWAFGKCKGKPVLSDQGFLGWALRLPDFPAESKKILRSLQEQKRMQEANIYDYDTGPNRTNSPENFNT